MRIATTRRRAGALAMLSAATLAVALLPAAGAEASSTSTITASGTGSSVKLSGTKGLKAGWVRLKISSTDDIWFVGTSHASPAVAGSGQGFRVRKGVVRSGTASPDTAPDASQIATTEQELTAFGGGSAQSKTKAGYFTIKLPAGTVYVEDLQTQKIIGTLTVGKSGSSSTPHVSGKITEGSDHVVHGPGSLPRSGTMEIENTGGSTGAWHDIGLVKLTSGATKSDVVNFFAGKSTKNPLVVSSSAGIEPISGGRTEYVQYSLAKGTYALIDIWNDDKTGDVYVAEGSVKIVKVS